jgi:hypothetical protein
MKRSIVSLALGLCLAAFAIGGHADPISTQRAVRPLTPVTLPALAVNVNEITALKSMGVPVSLYAQAGDILGPTYLMPAPPAVQNPVPYPYGAPNGEQVWIDSANGPQNVLVAPLIATTAGTPTKQISATTGKKIRVLGIVLSNLAAGSAQFQDEAGSPNLLSGVFSVAANSTLILPFTPTGYIDTAAGAALDIATTGTSNVQGGFIIYCLH